MTISKDECIEILNNNLNSKITLLNEILLITNEQKLSIIEEDFEKLNNYTENKQNLIDKVNFIDNDFLLKLNYLKELLGIKNLEDAYNLKLPKIESLKLNIVKINKILQNIMTLESENSEKINAEWEKLNSNIKMLKANKTASSAYSKINKVNNNSVYFDSKN